MRPRSFGLLFLPLLFLFIGGSGIAQKKHPLFSSNIMVGTKVHYGFLYPHHLELQYFNAHFPAFEVTVEKLTYGKRAWERTYNYPILGAVFFYSGLGYNPSLGQAFALMPFINFPLYRHKGFMVGFRFALGAGYIQHPFDRINNYKNLAIGSHINAAVNLMIEARYRINYFLTATGGVSLQHFSNGSLKLPNYGINAPLVNLGIAYRPFKENSNIGDRFLPPVEPFSAVIRHTIEFYFGGALGYKNMTSVLGQNYLVYHIYENTLFPVSKKSKFGFGFDLSYDPSHIKILEINGVTVTNRLNIVRPGINAAYELGLSRIGFLLNLGYYLGGQEQSNGPLYQKISVQYTFARNLFAQVMLKVHWGRADYIGWGLGYTFNVKYGKKTIQQ